MMLISPVSKPTYGWDQCDMSLPSAAWRKARLFMVLSQRDADSSLADPPGYRISAEVPLDHIAETDPVTGEIFWNPTKLAEITFNCVLGRHHSQS